MCVCSAMHTPRAFHFVLSNHYKSCFLRPTIFEITLRSSVRCPGPRIFFKDEIFVTSRFRSFSDIFHRTFSVQHSEGNMCDTKSDLSHNSAWIMYLRYTKKYDDTTKLKTEIDINFSSFLKYFIRTESC